VDKERVKDAPKIDDDGHLEPEEEEALYRHYGLTTHQTTGQSAGQDVTAGRHSDTTTAAPVMQAAPSTPSRETPAREASAHTGTDDFMTRSEEQLRVGTQTVETGRARMRKYVVEEQVTETVPVSHEEAVVTREPITDANRALAMDGPDITEAVHEVTLHAERAVVSKDTVAVERVRLATDTVQEQVTVNETVRKEQIEMDGDVTGNVTGDSKR